MALFRQSTRAFRGLNGAIPSQSRAAPWQSMLSKLQRLPHRPFYLHLRRYAADGSKEAATKAEANSKSLATKTDTEAAAVYQPVQHPWKHEYIANQNFLTLPHKIVLVTTLSCWPHRLPKRASNATLNAAYGRLRIVAATLTVFLMLAIAQEAIEAGRRARDGGDECLYDTSTARELQAAKRQWVRDFETTDAETRAALLNQAHEQARK